MKFKFPSSLRVVVLLACALSLAACGNEQKERERDRQTEIRVEQIKLNIAEQNRKAKVIEQETQAQADAAKMNLVRTVGGGIFVLTLSVALLFAVVIVFRELIRHLGDRFREDNIMAREVYRCSTALFVSGKITSAEYDVAQRRALGHSRGRRTPALPPPGGFDQI